MAAAVSSLKRQAVYWLLFLGVITAFADVCPNEHPESDGVACVGEPTGIETSSGTGGRRLLRGPHSPKRQDISTAPDLSNRRSLLAPMCSETDKSKDAIISCTNAVRLNPTAFSYPCGNGWAYQYSKATALHESAALTNCAQKHSEDQARIGRLTHTGSTGSSVGDRASQSGYSWNGISENIAWGYESAKSVVFGWMCSPGHRRNIMSCDTMHIGIGIAVGNGRKYHTQVFGCPRGTSCSCSGGQGGRDVPSSSPSPVYQRPGPVPDSPKPRYTPSPKPTSSKKPYFFSGQEDIPMKYFFGSDYDSSPSKKSPSPSPKGTAVYTQTYYPTATATATAVATTSSGNNANFNQVFSTGSNVGNQGSNEDDIFKKYLDEYFG